MLYHGLSSSSSLGQPRIAKLIQPMRFEYVWQWQSQSASFHHCKFIFPLSLPLLLLNRIGDYDNGICEIEINIILWQFHLLNSNVLLVSAQFRPGESECLADYPLRIA